MRAKLITTVAILWVAAVGAISIVLYATRPKFWPRQDEFDWTVLGAWTAGVTVAAAAAIAIIYVLTRKAD